jgi:hypothetical protein
VIQIHNPPLSDLTTEADRRACKTWPAAWGRPGRDQRLRMRARVSKRKTVSLLLSGNPDCDTTLSNCFSSVAPYSTEPRLSISGKEAQNKQPSSPLYATVDPGNRSSRLRLRKVKKEDRAKQDLRNAGRWQVDRFLNTSYDTMRNLE